MALTRRAAVGFQIFGAIIFAPGWFLLLAADWSISFRTAFGVGLLIVGVWMFWKGDKESRRRAKDR